MHDVDLACSIPIVHDAPPPFLPIVESIHCPFGLRMALIPIHHGPVFVEAVALHDMSWTSKNPYLTTPLVNLQR